MVVHLLDHELGDRAALRVRDEDVAVFVQGLARRDDGAHLGDAELHLLVQACAAAALVAAKVECDDRAALGGQVRAVVDAVLRAAVRVVEVEDRELRAGVGAAVRSDSRRRRRRGHLVDDAGVAAG